MGTGPSDADILNFALNLEYLEAQFYVYAATGVGLPASMLTGTGTQGAATGGRKATFTSALVRQYASEIAKDEIAHVDRSNIVPTDADGLAFSRSLGNVLNIVYLNPSAVSQGGFYPNGVNGTLAISSALG